ncbi:MAG: hypothetical protein ACE5NG_09140 [bacterium]
MKYLAIFNKHYFKIGEYLMGLTVLELEVGNPAKPEITEKVEF